MDCRKPLVLALGLLGCVAGCQSPFGGTRVATVTKKVDDRVAQKPATFVSFGDFRAKLGFSPEYGPAAQKQYLEEARLAYQNALKIDPKYVPAHTALARLYVGMEDYPRAAAAYQKAAELSDKDAALWFELGMCHGRNKDWPAAIAALKQALQRDPDNKHYATTLGFALARAGRYPESYEALARANGPAKAHYNLARALQHANRPAEARQHLLLALQAEPRLPGAHELLAELDGRATGGEQAAIQRVGHTESEGPSGPPVAVPLPPLPVVPKR
jgi:tetratricopeptide (TPR) repeat protein